MKKLEIIYRSLPILALLPILGLAEIPTTLPGATHPGTTFADTTFADTGIPNFEANAPDGLHSDSANRAGLIEDEHEVDPDPVRVAAETSIVD